MITAGRRSDLPLQRRAFFVKLGRLISNRRALLIHTVFNSASLASNRRSSAPGGRVAVELCARRHAHLFPCGALRLRARMRTCDYECGHDHDHDCDCDYDYRQHHQH